MRPVLHVKTSNLTTQYIVDSTADRYFGEGQHNNIHTFSYGYDKLRFIKPVFIGDTIYTIRTNLEKRPKYNEMGLVRVSYEVFKNKGELALYCEHLQTVKYRNPEAIAQFVEKR